MGYIFWGMQKLPPPERAGSYAMLIQAISLGKSVWHLIYLQGFLVAYLLRVFWVRIFKIDHPAYFYFSAFLLGIGSSLGWTAATLMPDIFCAVSSLVLFLLLFYFQVFTLPEKWGMVALFVFSSLQHVSIFLVNLLIIIFFGCWFLFQGTFRKKFSNWAVSFVLAAGSYVGIGLLHQSQTGTFFISRSSQAFLFGRLAETGILSNFLYQNCGESSSEICQVKHWFPMSNEALLWKNPELLQHLGGLEDRKGIFQKTNRAILSHPKFLFQFGMAAFKSMMKQLTLVEVGDGLGPYKDIFQLRFFGTDYADYHMSKQKSMIQFSYVNTLIYAITTTLLLVFFISRSGFSLSIEAKNFFIFMVILFIFNALINGGLATTLHRYQTRVFWLLDVWLLAAIYPALRQYFTADPSADT